jgi:adenine-specific DNA-methyltransferase
MIEGDNLEVLKLLQKSYAGKVKMIYIDPPYNTGKDFVYPDNFQDNIKNYLELTGQVEGGAKISSNTEASGRFHTDWLNMMYSRLKLARNLLRDDGVILISIDDHEVNSLRILCNEVFGEENFCGEIAVVNNLKGRNDQKHVATCHEFLVAYSKSDEAELKGLPLTDEQRARYKLTDLSGEKYALRDLRKRGRPDRREDRPKMWFPIFYNPLTKECSIERISPNDVEITPKRGDGSDGRWRWGKERVVANLAFLEPRYSKKNDRWDIDHRVYLKNAAVEQIDGDDDLDEDEGSEERSSKSKSVWMGGEFSTDVGRRTLKELLPETEYDYPKAIDFIKRCIHLGVGLSGITLDFFAGSGTTGHAVMAQNAADGGKRRYILVQLPEPLDPDNRDQKIAADFCDKLGKPRTIAELTKERLRRAGEKIREELEDKRKELEVRRKEIEAKGVQRSFLPDADDTPPTPDSSLLDYSPDLGFRVFKLDSTNIREWEPMRDDLEGSLQLSIDHLKTDRTERDILYELLLKLGLDLCVPMEKKEVGSEELEGKKHTIHSIGGGVLMACLSEKIGRKDVESLGQGIVEWRKALAPAGETTCVFRDSAFVDDVAKTNLAAILNQNGILNVRSL